jgi:hypothetical protein
MRYGVANALNAAITLLADEDREVRETAENFADRLESPGKSLGDKFVKYAAPAC